MALYHWITRMRLLSIGFVFIACAAGVSQAQNDCAMSSFQVQPDFDLERFMGKWYELSWIPENWFPPEFNFKDFIFIYSKLNDSYISIDALGREQSDSEDCFHNNPGLIVTDEPGKFLYDRIVNLTTGERNQSDYWVMATDYDNYAMVFGCRGRNEQDECYFPDGWVWSRGMTLDPQYETIVNNTIEDVCLTGSQFMPTEHNNECPWPISGGQYFVPTLGGLIASLISFFFL